MIGQEAVLKEGDYSDESPVQTSLDTPGGWVFRAPKDKYKKGLVNVQAHVKAEIDLMV
ncbi:hypothetical protein C7999DRAFT_36743 [Corynascus novoguineensis]|uniref:Uncharacterized protein n=1 Tax=Corynascus novoguineensis TaxID=1126955 RepID=A0AAN7CKY2_9PEZI|nr:hypothetical protein C7999DRAFT_36743 [Corynascus novoguineensis]